MSKNLAAFMLATLASSYALAEPKFVSVDRAVFNALQGELGQELKVVSQNDSIAVLEMELPQIEALSQQIHQKLHRCGGFVTFDTLVEAQGSTKKKINKNSRISLLDYSINQQELVNPMMSQVSEIEIRNMVLALSSFESRHYRSESGVRSSQHIFDAWKRLTAHRSDVTVELFQHTQWAQPSVIVTITGAETPEEIVLLGGHADSISWDETAPGADDNASGISSLTEVLRVLMLNNYQPKKTIQFMAYAAEEAGLLGSKDIAGNYQKNSKNVIGVLQLDMTLFKGTPDKDIVLIADNTSTEQNAFMGNLIDEYVKVPWGYTRCGYGCSDHASWTMQGYPASFPFEANFEHYNRNIHTEDDTLENAGGTAEHAVDFTKLAIAYVIELSN